MEKNKVNISGYAETDFAFDHEFYDERFYKMIISIKRDSGAADRIPVIVSEKLYDMSKSICGKHVFVHGEYRSYNQKDEGKPHIFLYVFASEFYLIDSDDYMNEIILEGFVCKKPTFRTTPLGRDVSDLILAVNRLYGKSDYIPCICWGRNAFFASGFEIGQHLCINGRIQSREYIKKTEAASEVKTAYEVSVCKLQCIE